MRLLFIALLAVLVIALLACVKSASVSTVAKMAVDDTMLAHTPDRILTNRVLSTSEANDKEDEERVISAGVESLAGLVKAGKAKLSLVFARDPPAAEVLKWFKLDKGVLNALNSPNLKAMENYMREVKPDQKGNALVIGVFSAHYGDDVVAKALVTAQAKANTVEAANWVRALRQDQLLLWLESGKSVDDVFKLLKFREEGYGALWSRKLEILDDYMKLYIREKDAHVTLLQTLTNGFRGEQKLAQLLVRAQADSRTSELATALRNALLNKWLTSTLHPESVFKNLKLDDDLMKLLENPIRGTLDRYISLYNAKNPNSKTSFIGVLTAHYGEISVAKELMSARMVANTKKIATKLQREQLQGWINSQKSADDVFALLKVNDDVALSMISTKLDTLDEYVKLFNTQNPRHKTDMITVLRTGFGGDGKFAVVVAKAIHTALADQSEYMLLTALHYENALFKGWWKNKMDPMDIYTKVFNVERAAAGPWERSIARRYTTYYNKKISRPQVNVFNNPRRS